MDLLADGDVGLSITPFLVYAAGGSDGATDSERAGLGAIGLALASPFLIVAAYFGSSDGRCASPGRAMGRSAVLALYGAIVFAVAWHAAHGPTFGGDSRWAAYWLLSSSGWLLLTWKLLLPKRSASSSHS